MSWSVVLRVGVGVQGGMDLQAGPAGDGADRLDDHLGPGVLRLPEEYRTKGTGRDNAASQSYVLVTDKLHTWRP